MCLFCQIFDWVLTIDHVVHFLFYPHISTAVCLSVYLHLSSMLHKHTQTHMLRTHTRFFIWISFLDFAWIFLISKLHYSKNDWKKACVCVCVSNSSSPQSTTELKRKPSSNWICNSTSWVLRPIFSLLYSVLYYSNSFESL